LFFINVSNIAEIVKEGDVRISRLCMYGNTRLGNTEVLKTGPKVNRLVRIEVTVLLIGP
jgi:hypothetical protein